MLCHVVLILIVVEDSLVRIRKHYVFLCLWVLILIVVEDSLVPEAAIRLGRSESAVLILIVVEDSLVLKVI